MFKLIRNTFTKNQSTDVKSIPSLLFYQKNFYFIKLKKKKSGRNENNDQWK